jgi:hypothetical protein
MNAAAVFRIALVLVVLPPMLSMMGKLRDIPGLLWLRASFLVMCVAYLAAVMEDVWMEPFFNAMQHLAIGVAGVVALVGVVTLVRGWPVPRRRS